MEKTDLTGLLSSGRPLVMGILNVTPDSFSDGGKYLDTDKAVDHALSLIDTGADIIDIGGESSRPSADPVETHVELERVIPVIMTLSDQTQVPISVDTYKAEVAKQAIHAGAAIVNDISALRFDTRMADVIAENDAFVVLMHMQGTPCTMQRDPQYEDVVADIKLFLEERIEYAVAHGIKKDRIILDPGIGFGKNLFHNLSILRHIKQFTSFGLPVLVGASRKRMIADITGKETMDRTMGTAAIVAHCVFQGITIHRVHDVAEMRQVCDVAAAIRGE